MAANQCLVSTNGLLMACHITGVYDVNRNETLAGDNYELVRNWAESIVSLKLQGIIFHNNFSEETCYKYENGHITFKKINYNPKFNPNVFRYFVYRDFLNQNAAFINSVFITDISDVVVVKNPFTDPFFIGNPNALFCGDEAKMLDNEWMNAHSDHLRKKISDYAEYEKYFAQETLLNCGIIGGTTPIFHGFIQKLCTIHESYNYENKTAYTGDMGAFNYLARTQYHNQLKHGSPINTVFKMYENDRTDCWFRHK
ncbi:MAG TPA: hypothetical protein PKD18_13140 [Saprospiraceae bacterium]|nr:hypothetical protein [Saprospiraceae bacterium]